MDDRTAGLVIRALRLRRGWRQTDLAARAAVSAPTVSRAERGWFDQLSLVKARFEWLPTTTGRVVVMPETMRLRRLVDRHPVIGRMFPVNAAAIRRWLRQPTGAFAGLWFLSDSRQQTVRKGNGLPQRRMRPGRGGLRAQDTVATGQNGA